jgi:hypothetical protein
MQDLYQGIRQGTLSCQAEVASLAQAMCVDASQAMAVLQQIAANHSEHNTNWLSALKLVLTIARKFSTQ